MAAVGKEAERAELHKTIWRIANDLRGSVDGWDFKAYVLGTLFYRFISENLTAYLNEQERRAGSADFDSGEPSTIVEHFWSRAVTGRAGALMEEVRRQRPSRSGVPAEAVWPFPVPEGTR